MRAAKTKKNKTIIIAMLAIIAIILMLATFAYAKYIKNIKGNGTATVAKWSFKVNDSEEGSNTFNLITTINKANNVAEGKIAPGTNGYFDLKLDGTGSEVAINYIINIAFDNKPRNMHFYTDEQYTVELPVENNEIIINDYIPLKGIDTPKTVRIYWNWPATTGNTEEEIYENNIADGEDMGKEINIATKVTGVQAQTEEKIAGYKAYYYVENANDDKYTLYTTKTYEKATQSDLTLSSIAINIPNATYEYGTKEPEGEHIANVQISEDGTTSVYLYYKRARYTLTITAGENIEQVTSKGISTGTSTDKDKFTQSKTKMETKYKYGESITITATPKQEVDGYTYTFKNWQTETGASLGEKYDSTKQETIIQMPEEDVAIEATATKTANTYTVTYNANTGTGKMESQKYVYGQEQQLTANAYTKTGYAFKNWNTKEDGTGTTYENSQKVSNLVKENNGELTLYAIWQANEYELVFNSNGGTGTMSNQKVKYDDIQKINKNEFTRPGYTFTGWNLSADGFDTSYEPEEQILNLTTTQGKQVTLYAIWSVKSYTVEFDANGGNGEKTIWKSVFF